MAKSRPKGPLSHRALVIVFSVLFGLLFYWLLGFLMNDIGRLRGPDYGELRKQLLSEELTKTSTELSQQLGSISRQIEELTKQQTLLKDSIENSRRTMGQLLDIQRLSLQKEGALSEEAQSAMAESIQLFLSNQAEYQSFNDKLSTLHTQRVELEATQRTNKEAIEDAERPIQDEYNRLLTRHNLTLAAWKLAVLVPVMILSGIAFLRLRESVYAPMTYAAGIAVTAKVLEVMHEHFSPDFFKYVLILLSLAVVFGILIRLLMMIARPKRDWLLKQYRDAYEAFLCPSCSYPIRRGPLKYLSWTRRSHRKLAGCPRWRRMVDLRMYPTPARCARRRYLRPVKAAAECVTRCYQPVTSAAQCWKWA